MLRRRFEAQTDIDIDRDPNPNDWKQYAEWLERLSILELNTELLSDNEMLRDKLKKAMDILEAAISGAHRKSGRCRTKRK